MKPVEIRIRIGKMVSDRPLDMRRDQFAAALSAEVTAMLADNGVANAEPANGAGVATHIAHAVARHQVVLSAAKDLAPRRGIGP